VDEEIKAQQSEPIMKRYVRARLSSSLVSAILANVTEGCVLRNDDGRSKC
jgi:hypothetical protein